MPLDAETTAAEETNLMQWADHYSTLILVITGLFTAWAVYVLAGHAVKREPNDPSR